jgi:toxin-antitoxin system PIN domain toxin
VSAVLIDTNVWIAAVFPSHPAHRWAAGQLAAASAANPACFCRATQQSLLRLLSAPVVLKMYGADGATNDDAITALEAFLALAQVRMVKEPPGIFTLWLQLGSMQQASPKLWMDAYLAAFAICGGMEFLSLDRDFEAFTHAGLTLRDNDVIL